MKTWRFMQFKFILDNIVQHLGTISFHSLNVWSNNSKDEICYQPLGAYTFAVKNHTQIWIENVNPSTDFYLTDFYSSQSHFSRLKIGRIKKAEHFQGYKSCKRKVTKLKNAAFFFKEYIET